MKPTRPSFLTMELTKWPCHHWDLRQLGGPLSPRATTAAPAFADYLSSLPQEGKPTTVSSGDNDTGKSPRPPSKPVKPPPAAGDGEGGPQIDPVCNIVERTLVNSPSRAVAATIRVGDTLSVLYSAGPPKQLLVETSGGATLGSLTPSSLAQLIQCILAGVQYEASVQSIQGGRIEVQVEPK